MRKIFFTLTLITIPILSIFASGEKETNLGAQIDVYAEYSPIEEVTISLGEEVSFTNFLATENGVFDATNTVFGVTYTPHPNIAIEAGYEFLYSNAEVMEHCATLAVTPQVELGDFSLALQEKAQMTYSMFEKSYNWQIVSNLEVAYAIPNTPLSAYIYTEMTNPLTQNPENWYDEFCHGVGLDWSIDEINTLGIYYEFSHTVDSYSHLIGIGYTASF